MSKTTIATCTYGPTGVLTKACSAGIFVYKTKYKTLIQNPSPNNLFMRRPFYKTKYCMIKLVTVTINQVAKPVRIGFAPASLNCWEDEEATLRVLQEEVSLLHHPVLQPCDYTSLPLRGSRKHL